MSFLSCINFFKFFSPLHNFTSVHFCNIKKKNASDQRLIVRASHRHMYWPSRLCWLMSDSHVDIKSLCLLTPLLKIADGFFILIDLEYHN